MPQSKSSSLSPTKKLLQAFSDFFVGFSIFLIVAGLIGTVFVIQDMEESASQDVRSEAVTLAPVTPAPPTCETIDICLAGATENAPESCSPREICEVPPGCYFKEINCTTQPCPYPPVVLICPTVLDDIFFADTTQLNSPTFYLDETGSNKIPATELKTGQTYYFSVEARLQNLIKNTLTNTSPSFFLSLTSNGQLSAVNPVPYSMLLSNIDGYSSLLEGSFVAQTTNTFSYYIDTIDSEGNVIIEETNYDNNTHTHTFQATACSNNADLNHDGKVDLRDYALLSREFLSSGPVFTADINCDNKVDIRDYSIMATQFSVAQ